MGTELKHDDYNLYVLFVEAKLPLSVKMALIEPLEEFKNYILWLNKPVCPFLNII